MKTLPLAVLLFASVFSCSAADCDITISSTDTPNTLKRKIACLAEENVKLKQAQTGKVLVKWSAIPYYYYKRSSWSKDACKSKAVDVIVVKRKGAVLDQGSDWIELRLGDNAISVLCDMRPDMLDLGGAETFGLLLIAGTTPDQMSDLVKVLSSEIFPPQ